MPITESDVLLCRGFGATPVDTRSLLTMLGFQEGRDEITDQAPAYIYDFGNLRLTATEAIGRFYEPVFFFVGAISGQRSIRAVQFEMPLKIDSFEQGVAWISYGLGDRFRPERDAHWLDDGRRWEGHLPWMHTRMSEFAGAPQARCFVTAHGRGS
jgi:hypothetical protein